MAPAVRQTSSIARSALALALVLACAACAAEPDAGSAPGCTPMPSEPVVLEGPAAMFDLTGVAEPIRYVSQDGYLVITARSDVHIPDLAIMIMDILRRAGFDIAGSDDEGFEAEVFFSRGQVGAGMVVLTESQCVGLVDVRITVLDDPAVLPDSDSSPSTAPPG